ncbi:MAG: hypothetical protein KBT27_01835 [Prevotellaceae bacterium]|nr:hypothetical protein [Candidatus Faecinaster equi]MCQ2324978.1 hypothetical protein [Paludibacteraceae bacterium]
MSKNDIRYDLLEKLKAHHCFWSYEPSSWNKATDDQIIEKTLIHLDLPEINQLFTLYGKQHVKRVWLDSLIPQGDYYRTLNRFFAWYYFGAKNPDVYLKTQETRHFNRMFA